jgi:RNA polymerase sigma factor (sigma-70 family)
MTEAAANIVKRCIKGDRKAQEALYDRYYQTLYGICLRYTKDSDDAKDVLQDVFVKIYGSLDSLKNPRALDAWVKQIAIRCSIKHESARRRKKHQE